MMEEKRYFNAFKMVMDSKMKDKSDEEINELLQTQNLKLSDIDVDRLLDLRNKKTVGNSPFEIYEYNNQKYILFADRLFENKQTYFQPHFGKEFEMKPPQNFLDRNFIISVPPKEFNKEFTPPPDRQNRFENIVLIDKFDEEKFKYFWCLVLFIIDILLIWFLFFLRKKLKPLFILKENMKKLSIGDFSISSKTDGKDEISQVAKEFENAVKQLKQLKDSRNLFLRNIMHELKTPITKGKLITDMYEESERKYILIRVFQRLEYLLGEFAKIEELTSGKIILDKYNYYAIELVEQALDILLIDEESIDIENKFDLELNVDFELFSIALKNLIDNAINYNTNGNPKIFIERNSIKIINKGEKLKKDIENYYKPFNHDYEDASSGLGLGLYISNNIINIHNFKLEYEYLDGYNNFVIKLN